MVDQSWRPLTNEDVDDVAVELAAVHVEHGTIVMVLVPVEERVEFSQECVS